MTWDEQVRDRERLRWVRRRWREAIRDSQWLLPALGALGGLLLALVVGTGGGVETHRWTVSVDRSRDTLIASLTLVFTSLSIVLAMASVSSQNVVSRFGSRTLRMYLRRSTSRWVLGLFAFAAVFILIEQFQLRRLDPDGPAPVAGLSISVVLLVLSGSTLIWYIASIVRWFRVDRAVAGITEVLSDTLRHIERARVGTVPTELPERPIASIDLLARRSGHLAEIDTDVILDACGDTETLIVITSPVGAPVVHDQPLGWMTPHDEAELNRTHHARVAKAIDISGTREVGDNLEYGLFSLVDIAIMALSPAVNDPNSAVEVIEEMSFLLPRIAEAPLGPYAVPDEDSWPRVVVKARSFGQLVECATTQIVLYGLTDPNVVMALRHLATTLDRLELSEDDRRYVDEFAAKLDAAPDDFSGFGSPAEGEIT